MREAIALLDAGVASAADIDLAVRTSFGIRFPAIGPLESADLSRPRRDRRDPRLPAARPRPVDGAAGRPDRARRAAASSAPSRAAGSTSGRTSRVAEVIGRRDRELVRRLRSWSRPRAEGGGRDEADRGSPTTRRPRSTECVALLAEHGDDAKPLAGGQSLVPLMNLRLAAPSVLVDLNGDRRAGVRPRRGRHARDRRDDAPPRRSRRTPIGARREPAARARRVADRLPRDPRPRHDRRQPGARRSRLGAAVRGRRARRRVRDRRAGRPPHGAGERVLPGLLHDRDAAGRAARRGALPARRRRRPAGASPSWRARPATTPWWPSRPAVTVRRRHDRRRRGSASPASPTGRSRPRAAEERLRGRPATAESVGRARRPRSRTQAAAGRRCATRAFASHVAGVLGAAGPHRRAAARGGSAA